MDCSPLSSIPSSGASSLPRDQNHISYVSCIGKQSLPLVPPGKLSNNPYYLAKRDIREFDLHKYLSLKFVFFLIFMDMKWSMRLKEENF